VYILVVHGTGAKAATFYLVCSLFLLPLTAVSIFLLLSLFSSFPTQAATIYAKQLVRMRQQKAKSLGLSSTITSTGHRMQVMQSQAKMAGAMGSTAKTMAAVNQQLKVEDIQKTMMNFEKESSKMEMAGELMDDAVESLFDDDEEEEDAVISQVLDEIGIDVQQKLSGVGVANSALPEQRRTKVGADTSDIEARLRELQNP
ncbi:Charged multivesicular body protein 2b, partial [Geodia barretti]